MTPSPISAPRCDRRPRRPAAPSSPPSRSRRCHGLADPVAPIAVALITVALVTVGLVRPVAAELRIDVTRGQAEPVPIAITGLAGAPPSAPAVGRRLAEVISADLESSGLFAPLPPARFPPEAGSRPDTPRFGDWVALRQQALVTGQVSGEPDGRLKVAFRLWDVFAEQQLTGLAYYTRPNNWRRVAHIIADAVYARLTGEPGYFDSRIVYIAESGPPTNRVKRLAIMDQDGHNHRYLTDGRTLVLTPRFSPTAQEITYLSFLTNKPRAYLFNIDTGRQEVLGDFPGITFAPRFSPDGNKVIMSLATGTHTNIYTLDLRTRVIVQLTDSPAIDTSPSYAPDGDRIAFESDRGGTQQIYVMAADGASVRRISFGDGRYASPVWSPRGDLIAFTRIHRGRFSIGVIRPDGTGERILAESFHVEGPTWAPNGRMLMFFRETPIDGGLRRRARLYVIDLEGRREREVVTPMDASDPAWSPLIP